MSHDVLLFSWEKAGDAIIAKSQLLNVWRRRIRASLQKGRYKIEERPTGEKMKYTWIGLSINSKRRRSTTKHETIAVYACFTNVSSAVFFKLKESDNFGGRLHENAARLGVVFNY